jgi:hypothetical protein
VSELVAGWERARALIWVLDVNHRVIAQAGGLRAGAGLIGPRTLRLWEAATG